MRSILHHNKRRAFLHVKVKDRHNVRMLKTRNHLCLRTKHLEMLLDQSCQQYFDCSLTLQMYMLTKVNISETSTSKEAEKKVVAQLLTLTCAHTYSPYEFPPTRLKPGVPSRFVYNRDGR